MSKFIVILAAAMLLLTGCEKTEAQKAAERQDENDKIMRKQLEQSINENEMRKQLEQSTNENNKKQLKGEENGF